MLYPFLPPADVDDDVISRLAAVFTAAFPFDCTFAACGWFGEDVLWLAPDRDREFTARIDHALLIAGTDRPSSWHTVAELPTGPAGLSGP